MLTEIASRSICELAVDFIFTEVEHDQLYRSLSEITANPYHEYELFNEQIQSLAGNVAVPTAFVDFCEAQQEIDRKEKPFIFIKNCPIDKTLPIFDFDRIFNSLDEFKAQRELKKTFIAEAFLILYATLTKTSPISYASHQGSWFRDVRPQKVFQSYPSGANLGSLSTHKEMVDHVVSPDYVNLLSLRNYSCNQVYTTFMRNQDILRELDEDTRTELRKKQFCTLYSRDAQFQSGDECYAILSGDINLRYFENYTRGGGERAQAAVEQLNKILHTVKRRVLMVPGDFVSLHNHTSLHGKEVHQVVDEAQLKMRWLIKTYNVDNLEDYAQYFVKGQYGVVDDKADILNILSRVNRGCDSPNY